ncbi:MAG: GNAT family N-acetyltransferase [Ginsengibacter sp.]
MVKQTLQIRRAVTGDAKIISELSSITFSDTFQGTCTEDDMQDFIDKYYSEALVTEELQDSNDFYFIAFIDDEAAGYMRIKEDESSIPEVKNHKSIELKRIYVLKEYHSKKVGAGLMQFALQFAADKGYELIWLGVWEHNERAINFYKKFGFTDTGFKHPFPIGNTPQTDNWLIKFIEK